jgi:hypothetical protein
MRVEGENRPAGVLDFADARIAVSKGIAEGAGQRADRVVQRQVLRDLTAVDQPLGAAADAGEHCMDDDLARGWPRRGQFPDLHAARRGMKQRTSGHAAHLPAGHPGKTTRLIITTRGSGQPDAPTYVMTTAHAGHPHKRRALAARHIAVRDVRPGPAGLDIPAVLRQLCTEGIRSIIVEDGARVITSMLDTGVVDQVIISISPRILGRGTDAVGELRKERIADALRLGGHSVHLIGGTIIVAADIAGPSGRPPDGGTLANARHD